VDETNDGMDWIGGIAAQNKFVSGTGLPFSDKISKVVTNSSTGQDEIQLDLSEQNITDGKLIVYKKKCSGGLSLV
jgi:hypothetical protein